jgi:hypothetical protein
MSAINGTWWMGLRERAREERADVCAVLCQPVRGTKERVKMSSKKSPSPISFFSSPPVSRHSAMLGQFTGHECLGLLTSLTTSMTSWNIDGLCRNRRQSAGTKRYLSSPLPLLFNLCWSRNDGHTRTLYPLCDLPVVGHSMSHLMFLNCHSLFHCYDTYPLPLSRVRV